MIVLACILFYFQDYGDVDYDAEKDFRNRIIWASVFGTVVGLIIAYLPKTATFMLSMFGLTCLCLVIFEAGLFYLNQ